MRPASLNAAQRERDLAALRRDPDVDVVVIGGGITGVGVALDAATRGLSVVCIERDDFASGTSRWSSKLIHGGLRYLRNGDLGVAWESARERHILMKWTAPHLVMSMPYMIPLTPHVSVPYAMLSGSGIRFGDVLRAVSGSSHAMLPSPRRISALEALRLYPALAGRGLRGAILFWDGQAVDDARIVIAAARTAAAYEARLVQRCVAEHVDDGTVIARDVLSNDTVVLHARCVINATGVWAHELAPDVHLRPSKGSHLVIRGAALGDPRTAMLVPVVGERARWVGANPTPDGHVIVGVTDIPHEGSVEDVPAISRDERTYLLSLIEQVLEHPIAENDIIGSYAGYRPLLSSGDSETTADISRKHAILRDPARKMITVVGGKFTTYRKMAEDAVDAAVQFADLEAGKCVTERTALVGAGPAEEISLLQAPERLRRRFGREAEQVVRLAHGKKELLTPLGPEPPVLPVEALWAVRHEGALQLDDILDRRLRLDLVPEERERLRSTIESLVELPIREHVPA